MKSLVEIDIFWDKLQFQRVDIFQQATFSEQNLSKIPNKLWEQKEQQVTNVNSWQALWGGGWDWWWDWSV